MQVFFHPSITLAKNHVSGVKDSANANCNTLQSMFLMRARRSCYDHAPCGETGIGEALLHAMLKLAETYRFRVSEIAGGSHGGKSRHYVGVAMDVDQIDGAPVSAANHSVHRFMTKCRLLGATEVLGPGDAGHATHVHAAWPRPKSR